MFSRAAIYIFKRSYLYFQEELFLFSRAALSYFQAALFLSFLKQLFDFRKPSSSMTAAASDARSLHLIRCYFSLGLNYDEIIASLASNHNIFISKCNLNRKLRELCLWSVVAKRFRELDSSSGVVRMCFRIPAWPVAALGVFEQDT